MDENEVEQIKTEGARRIVQLKIAKAVSNRADLQDHTEFVKISCHACFPDADLISKQTEEKFVTICSVFVAQDGHLQPKVKV